MATPSTETAWVELHANIRGFVARRVRQPADVDDIVQQVFLRVHQALPTLRDAAKLPSWIYQTTRRTIVDHYRAPAQRREVPAGAAIDVVPEARAAEVVSDEREESALRELAACLKPLMSKLAEADQEALRLVELDGVTQVAAARRLGLSVSGMKSRVQRARAHLRSALDECCRVALDSRGGVIEYERRGESCGSCGCADGSRLASPSPTWRPSGP
jgi:RNA polymerase sigma-70 factor (ECF subfamily)